MSSRKQVLTASLLALVMALAIIASAAYLAPISSKITNSQVKAGQGQLDILLTDPPTVPAGVTGVYVTYSHVALHNDSGWIDTKATGTIDLMKVVNVSITIAAVQVSAGVYNALRFNVSSAAVTYNGVNYTAFVPKAELTVAVPGGIQVTATKTSAALIDMHPTVMNIGSESTPEFIVDTAANGYNVPQSAIVKGMDRWGFRMSLVNAPWWTHINEQYTANTQITTATLSSTSLSVTIKNTGSEDVNLSAISVTPLGNECVSPVVPLTTTSSTTTSTTTTTTHGEHNQFRLPQCFTGSALFVVFSNGTLKYVPSLLLGGFLPMAAHNSHHINIFADMGYKLATGQSVTLTFSGTITLGFSLGKVTPPGVISGDQYDVTVVGPQALAEYVVVAS